MMQSICNFFKKKCPSDQPKRVVIVVGHHLKAQGAKNYKGESEWSFNKRIAQALSDKLMAHGLDSTVIFRPPGLSYSQQVDSVKERVSQIDPQACVCLHFNSANVLANGLEILIAKGSKGKRLAWYMADRLNHLLGLSKRHGDGILPIEKGHGGYKMLRSISGGKRAAVLVEPCFANLETEESKAVFDQEDKYVMALSYAIRFYLQSL